MLDTMETQAERTIYVITFLAPKDWQAKLLPQHGGSEWGIQTQCPACGGENVHFSAPFYQASDNYEAWSGRGDAIRIPMFCEWGHTWTLRLGFHKGYTFVDIENLQEIVHPTAEALALLPKYAYNPATRYQTTAGRNLVSEAQLKYMQSLRLRNRNKYDELVRMMMGFWGIDKIEHLHGADAGHIIKMMQ